MRSTLTVWSISIAVGLAVGVADYLTGLEVRVFPFYFISVGISAWWLGRNASMAISAWNISMWEIATRWDGVTYSESWIDYWNVGCQLCSLVAFGWTVAKLRSQAQQEYANARIDILTAIPNRRALMERLIEETERAKRYGHALSIAYVDIDDFKHINDRHGHAGGDQVLKDLSSTLRQTIRASDFLARMGGDEFAILVPQIAYDELTSALKRIHSELESWATTYRWPVTISMGAACFEVPSEATDEIIRRADGLMYEVKRKGKNGFRIERYCPPKAA